MMLGATIAEAKERMTYREAVQWAAYRAKHGGITAAARVENQLASLQAIVVQALGGKATPQEFLPGMAKPEPKQPAGINLAQATQAFRTMGMVN